MTPLSVNNQSSCSVCLTVNVTYFILTTIKHIFPPASNGSKNRTFYLKIDHYRIPLYDFIRYPDSKVNGANMGPTWVLSAPYGPHVGPMNLAIADMFDIWYLTLHIIKRQKKANKTTMWWFNDCNLSWTGLSWTGRSICSCLCRTAPRRHLENA